MSLETYELDKKMLENSISQYRVVPEYVKICEAFSLGLGTIQNAVNYLSSMIDLEQAEGIWLDYIGWLVGVTRTDLTDTSIFFSANAEDVNEEKLFWFAQQDQNQNITLSDTIFRSYIKGKIGYNVSHCTREENIKNIKNTFNVDHVIIDNIEPMVLDITLYGDNVLSVQNMRTQIEKLLGDGVGIRNLNIRGLEEYE